MHWRARVGIDVSVTFIEKKGVHDFTPGEKHYDGGETSDGYNAGLPVVAFCFTDEFKKIHPKLKQEAVSKILRARQYIVPNYPLPPNEIETEILRVVVRESMGRDLLDRLISDLCAVTESLMEIEDEFDVTQWQTFPPKGSSSRGDTTGRRKTMKEKDSNKSEHVKKGIHRQVC